MLYWFQWIYLGLWKKVKTLEITEQMAHMTFFAYLKHCFVCLQATQLKFFGPGFGIVCRFKDSCSWELGNPILTEVLITLLRRIKIDSCRLGCIPMLGYCWFSLLRLRRTCSGSWHLFHLSDENGSSLTFVINRTVSILKKCLQNNFIYVFCDALFQWYLVLLLNH